MLRREEWAERRPTSGGQSTALGAPLFCMPQSPDQPFVWSALCVEARGPLSLFCIYPEGRLAVCSLRFVESLVYVSVSGEGVSVRSSGRLLF